VSLLASLTLGFAVTGMSSSADDYPIQEWASLWKSTCGTIDSAYSVIDDPAAFGWESAGSKKDEDAARVIETVKMQSQAMADDFALTGLFVLRRTDRQRAALAAFQEMQFVDDPSNFLLACVLYDTSAPELSVSELSKLSDEASATDVSDNGLSIVEWPSGPEASGRIKMTAGSIPKNHPGAQLLLGGLVLKTQYVFSETSE
jgi:hypothetical protein